MAQQTIDIGSAPNDGTGDPIRDAFDKCNDNFTELYGSLAGLLDFQGATDCSGNPNYPAASQGDIYIVSVAGKIGGASGKDVEVGDFYLALADNAGGTEASVGTSWAVLQANITGGIGSGVDVEDEGVSETVGATTLNFVGAGVTAADAGGGVVDITIPGGGASALDDLTDVDLTGATTGDVLTFDGVDWVAQTPATLAAAGWALTGVGQTVAGVWDFAVDGAKANIDFTGLAGATDIRIVMVAVTKGTTGVPNLVVSVDNGSSYYTSSGDYVFMDTAGVVTNATSMCQGHLTNATAARSCVMEITNSDEGVPIGINTTVAVSHRQFLASTSPINAVRVSPSGGGNFTGGKIYCLARMATGSSAVLDDLSDVDTTGQTTGDVLTYDGAEWVPQAPSGGAAWALAGAGQTATGVYDFAVDGAKASIDFTGLGSFNELLIVGRGLTWTVSGVRIVHASVDNGSTFYTTSGDYVVISNAGVEANATGFNHGTSTTAARSLVVHIRNLKGAVKAALTNNNSGIDTLFVASASDINAIRFTNSGGGNSGAGTVRVYAR